MVNRPQARSEGIVGEWVEGDLVIYDQLNHTAHSLSAAAASVWERCNGKSSTAEVAEGLALTPEMVDRATSELDQCGLLDDGLPLAAGLSRREAAKRLVRVGGAALAGPLIYSAAIGPAVAAASGSACYKAYFAATGLPDPTSGMATAGTKGYTTSCTVTPYNYNCYVTRARAVVCANPSCNVYGMGCGTCCAGPSACVSNVCNN